MVSFVKKFFNKKLFNGIRFILSCIDVSISFRFFLVIFFLILFWFRGSSLEGDTLHFLGLLWEATFFASLPSLISCSIASWRSQQSSILCSKPLWYSQNKDLLILALVLRAFGLGNLSACLTSLNKSMRDMLRGGILMVFTSPRMRFLPWALMLVSILLFDLALSQVSSSFLSFLEENVLLNSHLDFLGGLGRALG